MSYIFLQNKVAACILGGLLFFTIGCTLSSAPEPNVSLTQVDDVVVAPTETPTRQSGVVSVSPATSTPTLSLETSATPTITPSPTPTVPEMPIPVPEDGPFSYHIIAEGQTLGYISLLYQTELETLVAMNNLAGPSALIQVGQSLRIPVQTDIVAPDQVLLPDSEVVYSPVYVEFDTAQFVQAQGGYLSTYREYVNNEELSGVQIVERVAEQFSVGPRLLLALLEHYGGWVSNPTPTDEQLRLPLGPHNPRGGSLFRAMTFTANHINAGYYNYKRNGFWIFYLPDGSQAISAQGLNAGTVGLQNILSIHSDFDTWQQELKPNGFMATYRHLFGNPFAYQLQPLIPITLTQPALRLPWGTGQGFYFTSGPHAGYVNGSAWAAIDFGPPDVLGNCFYSDEPNTAAADGVVVVARQGEVYLDLDGDGNIQTGWVLLYLHTVLDADTPVQIGQQLAQGDIIGYASCDGGAANSSHLHFARRYNGEWMDAGGSVPMNLSGWEVQTTLTPYEGIMVKGDEIRTACECWDEEQNLIVNVVDE